MKFKSEYGLLKEVDKTLKHSGEIERLKGEKFNIFSILKMEAQETSTHSAFIAELLNPDGSHLKGCLFLKLFLDVIENNEFDYESAFVTVEKFIGRVDDEAITGGRVDIEIRDKLGRTISIENKVYAKDQLNQVARYHSYNLENNKVYFLTLEGNDPGKDSYGSLKPGVDFFCISYRKDIIQWLECCLRASTEEPILRETIKQYIILIKKLTGLLTSHEMEKELFDLIINNYASAEVIKSNFEAAVFRLQNNFREGVLRELKIIVGTEFSLETSTNVDKVYSSIYIQPIGSPLKLRFGIESFSGKGHFNGNLFCGIWSHPLKAEEIPSYLNQGSSIRGWPLVREFSLFQGYKINMSNGTFLQQLNLSPQFHEEVVNHVVTEFKDFYESHKENILSFVNNYTLDSTQKNV